MTPAEQQRLDILLDALVRIRSLKNYHDKRDAMKIAQAAILNYINILNSEK